MADHNTFAEMFSGIGGFRLGLERSGWRCVWANDWDKYANRVYKKKFGDQELVEGDIREVEADTIPDHTLLTAGFPCQAFSVAGKRKGFSDTRGTLFQDIARVASHKKPSVLLLENVEGLLSAKAGVSTGIYRATKGKGKGELTDNIQTVKDEPKRGWEEVKAFVGNGYCLFRILKTLDEMGYLLEWQCFNSKYFGVPQNRERVFIIGHLGDGGGGQIFPIGENDEEVDLVPKIIAHRKNYRRNTQVFDPSGISEAIDTSGGGGRQQHVAIQPCLTPDRIQKRQHGRRFKENGEPIFTLTGQDIHGVAIKKVGNIFPSKHEAGDVLDPSGISETLRPMGPRGSCKVQAPKIVANTVPSKHTSGRVVDPSGISPTFLAKHNKIQQILQGARIRRLTPTECERLQGFPDGWTEGISDTQRYKVLGNAVTVNVIEFLGKKFGVVDGRKTP